MVNTWAISGFKHSKLTICISSLIFVNANVPAQEAAIDEVKSDGIEKIIVVARKKEELIQKVPISIVAVTGDHIQNMDINDLQDLSTFVPGLEQPKLGLQSRLSLRGVASGDNTSFEQSVGTYVDSIYRGRMHQQRSGFFDMERIEVLKGPQVTLYGNSSIGGAISMITNRPELDYLSGDITVKQGFEFDESQVLGGINLPVTSTFALRIAGKYRDKNNGVLFNENPNIDDFSPQEKDEIFRISAYWEINDKLNLFLRHEQGDFQTTGANIAPLMHINSDGTPNENTRFEFKDGIIQSYNGGLNNPFINGSVADLIETKETMLELVYFFNDNVILTSITANSSFDYNQSFDTDMSRFSLVSSAQNEVYNQFSQELRLAVAPSNRLDFIVGLYYQDDDLDTNMYNDVNLPMFATLTNPLLIGAPDEVILGTEAALTPILPSFSRHFNLTQNTKQTAVFTQINYSFSKKWNAALGLRYVTNKKTANQSVVLGNLQHEEDLEQLNGPLFDFSAIIGILNTGAPFPPGTVPSLPAYGFGYQLLAPGGKPHVYTYLERKENHFMYQGTVSYQATDDFMLYLSLANGAKSGGFDQLYEDVSDNRQVIGSRKGKAGAEFEDEETNTIELGFKRDWDDLRFNASFFYGKYEDLQVSTFDGSASFKVGNAAEATQKGIDLELIWLVTDNLTVFANAEYLDFTYDEYDVAGCSFSESPYPPTHPSAQALCDWSGRTVPWVPEVKAVVAFEYLWEISENFDLTQMLSTSYKSAHTVSADNEELTKQDALALIDYRAMLTSSVNDWHAAFTVSNLSDEQYDVYASRVPLNFGAFGHAVGKGREITLEFGFRF